MEGVLKVELKQSNIRRLHLHHSRIGRFQLVAMRMANLLPRFIVSNLDLLIAKYRAPSSHSTYSATTVPM